MSQIKTCGKTKISKGSLEKCSSKSTHEGGDILEKSYSNFPSDEKPIKKKSSCDLTKYPSESVEHSISELTIKRK